MNSKKIIESNSLEDTKKIALEIKKNIKPNLYILLSGDLGAGKTTFTKQLLLALGVEEQITSPTFVIMNQYESKNAKINHVDAYRLTPNSEVEMYEDEFEDSINIIEWYENMGINFEDKNYIKINIRRTGDNSRQFEIEMKEE